MLALLKLIPTSVWVTLAAVIALALTVLWFRDHERAIQHAADVAADQRVEATQMIHNEEVEARAKVLTDNAVAAYKAEHAAPPAADAPSVVCTLPAARPRPVPANGGAGSSDHGAADVPVSVAPESNRVDIGPVTDKLLEDADAQITALQAFVNACIASGVCKAPQ